MFPPSKLGFWLIENLILVDFCLAVGETIVLGLPICDKVESYQLPAFTA